MKGIPTSLSQMRSRGASSRADVWTKLCEPSMRRCVCSMISSSPVATGRSTNFEIPASTYSAARFRDDALTAMREITERGRIPLLAGGTMLYFKSLVEGLNELPEADPTALPDPGPALHHYHGRRSSDESTWLAMWACAIWVSPAFGR